MLRSLRSRLLLGSFLWSAGLLVYAHMFMMALIHVIPGIGHLHPRTFAIFAALSMLAGLIQVRRGVSPIGSLRERLAAVREGRDRRVEGTYPTEVQPLVSDLNALLEHREEIVRRAMTTAGDLAHGLKTPLAILAQEAELAEESGQVELAATIHQQVTRMQRQVDYHLARARAAASGATPGSRTLVKESAQGLARTMARLYLDRSLAIDVNVAPEHAFRGEREDLDEMLGNLVDNACKWARTRVSLTSSQHEHDVVITVDDDGPGIDASLREVVLHRGVRADEAAPGSGLGLAIVRDLAALYGGSIVLETSPSGGVRATLQLPSA